MRTSPPAVTGVRILGGVHAVAAGGAAVDLPSPTQRRLLALLALGAPRRRRTEWLAEVLGISPASLRRTISRLRTILGESIVETTATGYVLTTDVDAAQFAQAVTRAAQAQREDRLVALEHALGHWNGQPLEEFTGEEWAEGDSARLTELHAATVDDLADALIEACRPAEAVALLEEQISEYPYRDPSRGLLIRALASAGRQAEALRTFQAYRTLLTESGTEPSAAVGRIERRVATGWHGLEETARAMHTAHPPTGSSPGRPAIEFPRPLPVPTDFVGRTGELAALTGAANAIRATGLQCVVLTGEPGIGKSALLAAAAVAIGSDGSTTVVYGRCDAGAVSFEPFRSVLSICVANAPAAIVAAHVVECGGELARLVPALATRIATVPAPTDSDDDTQRFLLFAAVADLIRRLAGWRPLVLMLDDLHAAEPTALLLLRHLLHALADSPVLFVLSSRDPSGTDATALREEFASLAQYTPHRLALTGLDEPALAAIVSVAAAAIPDAARRIEQLQALTAGHPLYATQLVRYWAEGGNPDTVPTNVREVVWNRVRILDDPTPLVLSAAAVLGDEFSEDVLAALVGMAPPDLAEVLDGAARAGLVNRGSTPGRSWRFAHSLVARAMYEDLAPAQRARFHAAAARALEDTGDSTPGRSVSLADHHECAGQPDDALRWLVRAGDDALAELAPVEAVGHFARARDLAMALGHPGEELADLHVRLGDAQHRAGDASAFATLAVGAELAQRFGAREPLVRAAFAADRGFMRVDRGAPEFLELVEAALAVTDPTEVATYARLRALLARSLTYTPDAPRRVAAAESALDLAARSEDPRLLAQVAPAALYALWEPGRRELRRRVAAEAVQAAERVADPLLTFGAHQAAYNVAVESADPVGAARSLARMRTLARVVAEPRLQWTLGLYEAFETMMAGRLDEAEAIATTNLDRGLGAGVPDAFTFFAGQVFVAGSFAGRHRDLMPLVEQAANDSPGDVPFRLAYAICSAEVGDIALAQEVLTGGRSTRFSEIPTNNLWMTTIIGYAVLAIDLEDATAAAELLPLIEPFAAEVAFNGATSQGPVAAYVGKLASLVGQHDQAEDQLRDALTTTVAFGWEYHRATTLFALAQDRRRRDGALDAESISWLREASALCHAGGFQSWIPKIDALSASADAP